MSDPSGEQERREGRERERDERPLDERATRIRGENNITRFPHTERLRPTRGDGGSCAPRRRRVAKVFEGVFRERESVVISARLDGRSQGVDAVGPLSHGGPGQPRIGSGFAQVGPCPVTRCGTLSTGGCPARETSRGGLRDGWESVDAMPCVATRRHNPSAFVPAISFLYRSN